VIDRKILTPTSYAIQQTAMLLANGVSTGYGLGVSVGMANGHRLIAHNGEVSGFTTQNSIFPDDRIAVVVTANLDATGAPGQIAGRIADALFATADAATQQAVAKARAIFTGLQQGKIDRSLFSANANAYFSEQALKDFASSLAPLGPPVDVTQTGQSLRGGMVFRAFRIRGAKTTVSLTTFTLPDGKLEQYQIASP
jgi:D-alanyl-D-alanine carboxypeptidase